MCKKYILLLLTVCCCVSISNAQNFLKNFSSVGPLTKYNNLLLFAADDGAHGVELWKTDGTIEGTAMVKDIAPGNPASAPNYLTVYNGKVYFAANDGVNGTELWKTDGTPAGTSMVKDINPARIGNNGSNPASLTVVNGVLVFTGTDSDSTPTSALFKTDGTAAGTIRLNDLDYSGSGQLTLVKNNIYFTHAGTSGLWKTDGTIAGTKPIPVDDYYTIDALHAVSDGLVFITNTSYRQSIHLYHLGANDDKPVLLHQYDAVTYGSNDIDNITAVGNGFFFSIRTVDANDKGVDYLWHSDGTPNGTVSLKNFDWQRYSSGSQMQDFVSYNNKLYFAATSNFALWSSDGTAAGTAKVSDAALTTAVLPVVSNGQLFYNSAAGLWAVDASGTAKSQFTSPVNPAGLFDFNNTLYFTSKLSYNSVTGLWNNIFGPSIVVTSDYTTLASGDKTSLSSKVDSAVVKSFVITNAGTTDLVLSEISVAGIPFYVNGTPAQIIKAGKQTTFKLEYLPAKEIQDKGSLLIRSNDSFQGNFVVNLAGSSQGKADIKKQLPGGGLLKSISFTDTAAMINLSAARVSENQAKATAVGSLSVKNTARVFTYQLISGTGSADNKSFTIEANVLKTNTLFKYADKNTYTIRVKASGDTTSYEQVFAISVNQVANVATAANCSAVVQNAAYGLYAADFAGNRVVVAGGDGVILKSDNNGKDWVMANSGYKGPLNKIQFTDAKTGYASYVTNYSFQSILLKTEDAGDNWFPVNVADEAVRNTFFVTNNIGYAFTDQASLKTTDGGRSWKKNTSAYFSDINSVYFIDDQTGFVCGSDLTLMRTKNGGDTWQKIANLPLGQFTNLFKVLFTSAKTGYIVSNAGDVLKTVDGGDTWIRVSVVSSYIGEFYFTDDNTGYVVGSSAGSTLYKTTDGGVTWKEDLQPGYLALAGIKFNKSKTIGIMVGSGNGYGSGPQGRNIWIKENNDSWKNLSALAANDYFSINFTDSKKGYVFGLYKNEKTTDGGLTWQEMPITGTYGLRHSAFINNTGYAADLVDLYKTTDAGSSWTKILTGDSPDQIRSVYFLNADTGFYSTFSGSGLIAKTTNGGVNWTKTQVSTFDFVNNIAFFNSQIGFAVGSEGLIMKTTDGGTTWNKTTGIDNEYWFTSVHVFDASNIIVGGLKGVLLRSKDGGTTWELIKSTIQQGDISHMRFIDKNHGYVFTGNYGNSYNYIFETIDGGTTWHSMASLDSESSGVASYGNVVYLAGNGGALNKIESPVVSPQLGYISGDNEVAEKVNNQYTVAITDGTMCNWAFTGDAKMTTSGNTATVQWNSPGKYQLQVSAYSDCGPGSVRSLDVTVDSAFQSKITGPDTVLAHTTNVAYTALLHSNNTYNWVVSGDSTYTTNANKAGISWGNPGTGKIEVIETQPATGLKTSALLNVVIKTAPYSLPQTNFKIMAVAVSCKGSNNGQIKISADRKLNYVAGVQMSNTIASFSFKDSVSVNNLAPGTYHVCLTVTGQPGYQQCYDVVISEPKDLSVYATLNKADRTITLAFNGGSTYHVNLNGTVYTTAADNITLELAGGSNTVAVTTDKVCQGEFKQVFVLPANIVAYPNPFVDKLTLQLNTRNATSATVAILNLNGKMVYSGSPAIEENKITLALGSLESGLFVLKLNLDNKQTSIKIWKK